MNDDPVFSIVQDVINSRIASEYHRYDTKTHRLYYDKSEPFIFGS